MAKTKVEVRGVESLRRVLKRTAQGIATREVLGKIGTYLTFSIKRRVQERSEDVFGSPLVPYVPAYKLWRQENKYGTEVDLTLTGSMFASLTHTTYSNKVVVFFAPGEGRTVGGGKRVQNPAKAFYLQEKRKFFGYTDEDVTRIMYLYSVNLGEALRGS